MDVQVLLTLRQCRDRTGTVKCCRGWHCTDPKDTAHNSWREGALVPTLSSNRFRRAPMVLLPRSLLFSAEQSAGIRAVCKDGEGGAGKGTQGLK